MKIDKEALIEWAWCNLRFTNDPESWEDTYIEDILNGYNNSCYDNDGYAYSYSQIREMFKIDEEDR